MVDISDAEEPPKMLSGEDFRAFIEWLHLAPPYELIGRVICEASAVEAGLIQCAHQAGADPKKLAKMRTSQLVTHLRTEPHPSNRVDPILLERIAELLQSRNVLAHGAPMNLWGCPNVHGFVKHNRRSGEGYEWVGLTEEELVETARELEEIGELLQSVVLTHEEEAKRHSSR